MKEKIPSTAEIIIADEEDKWRFLVNNIINQLKTRAVINLPSQTIKLNLNIYIIIPPEKVENTFIHQILPSADNPLSIAYTQIFTFLINKLESKKWILIGEIDGEQKIPIILVHYPVISTTFYSTKLDIEQMNDSVPDFWKN